MPVIQTDQDKARLLELLRNNHTYPGDHRVQIIVRQEEATVTRVLGVVAAHVGRADLSDRTVQVPSKNGSYVSLRIAVPMNAPEDVIALYELLDRTEGLLSYF